MNFVIDGYLVVIWPHHRQNGRDGEISSKDDSQRYDNSNWYGTLWILCFFSGRSNRVEANEPKETFCCSYHYATYTKGHKTTGSWFLSSRWNILRGKIPIFNVGCREKTKSNNFNVTSSRRRRPIFFFHL